MAKCVVCTAINAKAESKRHPNPSTLMVASLLEKRRRNTLNNPSKFCRAHRPFGTGRATIPEAIADSKRLTDQDEAELEAMRQSAATNS